MLIQSRDTIFPVCVRAYRVLLLFSDRDVVPALRRHGQ